MRGDFLDSSAALLTVLLSLALGADAGTPITSDFASLPAGSLTQSALNGATTGGNWWLNPGRGATFEVQDSGGDKALLFDDPDGSGNDGTIIFGGLTLDAGIDLTSEQVTWTFRTGTRRTGNNKGLRFEFLNHAGSTAAATIDWSHSGSTLTLNSGQDSATNGFAFLNPWDAGSTVVRDVSVTITHTTVTVDFGSSSLTGTNQNGAIDIGRLRVWSIGSSGSARGVFLDDITVTTATAPPLTYSEHHYRGLTPGDPDYDRDLIRVYHPPAGITGVETRPAILMFHGGGWGSGSAAQFFPICQALANMGFVTAAANYRYSSHSAASSYPDNKELCIADSRLATAWLAGKAVDFGFAPDQIILGGGSAGGHIATMVALMPDDLTAVSAAPISIPALLLFNPAYHESEISGANSLRVDPERQLAALLADSKLPPPAIHFFGNYDNWRLPGTYKNASGTTVNGIGRALPFIDACRDAGAEAELWYAFGEGHSFFNATEWWERCITEVDPFLTSLGIAPGAPVPPSFAHPELSFELGTDLHAWRLEWFLNEDATGDAGDDANPDNDPFDNFAEFALGTNPLIADPPATFSFDSAGGTLGFNRRTHTYAYADPAATVELQWSPDLAVGSWLPFPIPPGSVVETNDGIESLAVPIDPDSVTARFFRLEIGPYSPSP